MGISPTALYSDLITDLSVHIKDQTMFDLKMPPPDVTPREYACLALARSFYKKFVDNIEPSADERALKKFLSVNERCGAWALCQLSEWDAMLVGELKDSIYKFWTPSGLPLVNSYEDILDLASMGPGAAVGAYGNDFYTKLFSSPFTATRRDLYHAYENYVASSPTWSIGENLRRAMFGECDLVSGSRLYFVPKQNDISRLICVEPSLNVYYQLGFGAHLTKRLDSFFGIDLTKQQDVNRNLACIGSLRGGTYVTIDLSSASDSMSLNMLKYVLPPDFYRWLLMLRSPYSDLTRRVGAYEPGKHELNMVSSMGNGFTFPLQTMLFSCIVSAALRMRSYPGANWGRRSPVFSVFGDDIVCPEIVSRDVLRLLQILGFEVNTEKSFVEGPFRESCGHDYFKGSNVRGFYVKKLETIQDRYAVINGLNLWSAKTGVSLPRTIKRLLSTVRYQPVPPSENDDAGVKVPSYLITESLRRDKGTKSVMYRRSVSKAKKIRFVDEKVFSPRQTKQRIFNPNGLLTSMLHGSVKSGVINIRHGVNHYATKWGIVPYWDYIPPGNNIALLADWQRWETAVYLNHFG